MGNVRFNCGEQGLKRIWILVFLGLAMISRVDVVAAADSKLVVSNSKNWGGTWYLEDSTTFSDGQITIKPLSEERMHFEFQVLDGVQNGQVEGIATLKGNSLVWNSPEVSAQFTFLLKNNEIVVSTKGEANYYAGYGVSFDGAYSRKKCPPPDYPLTDVGIFRNEVEEDAFQKQVGQFYDLFVSSMQVIDEESDTHTKTRWYTGFVSGDASFRAAIIGIDVNGIISAAVLDERSETIRYFNNNKERPEIIPKPIRKWINLHTYHGWRFKNQQITAPE